MIARLPCKQYGDDDTSETDHEYDKYSKQYPFDLRDLYKNRSCNF
jgi:hypothetical protein